ncbi:hypothetical protein MNBD_NITROSPINAE04-1339 [hydrothermal vent metagenome]|uniref:Cobalt transporter CbtA n=1 Tax=hydrothermal vent metagenome TaxID=652676 RepID=A0A3B1CKR5_9ZZZZ
MRIFLVSGIVAGLGAGFLLGLMQVGFITPIIVEAEVYENQIPATHEERSANNHDPRHHLTEKGGIRRSLFTILGASLLGSAIGIVAAVLMGVIAAQNLKISLRQGLLLGLAGYLAFNIIPGLGVAPAPPGVQGAPFDARQSWWLISSMMAVAGFITWAVAPHIFVDHFNVRLRYAKIFSIIMALSFIATPFIIGAPVVELNFSSEALRQINSQFLIVTFVVNAVFWMILGSLLSLTTAYIGRRHPGGVS